MKIKKSALEWCRAPFDLNMQNQVKSLINKETEIKSINLNVPLINSNSLFYNSEIEIENELISELHLKKAINRSEFFEESTSHQILMNYIINYDLDNKTISGSPLGNYVKKLNLNFYKLSVDKNIINTYLNLFKELDIHIENFIGFFTCSSTLFKVIILNLSTFFISKKFP